MPKFPVDAPRARVLEALAILGFSIEREREHISLLRHNARWHPDAVDHAESPHDQGFDAADDLYAGGH